jgi:hypothetical protein
MGWEKSLKDPTRTRRTVTNAEPQEDRIYTSEWDVRKRMTSDYLRTSEHVTPCLFNIFASISEIQSPVAG